MDIVKMSEGFAAFCLLAGGIVYALAESSRSQYIPVSKTPQPGKAPGMKSQLLTREGEEAREYALIFAKGDEVASGLLEFAQQHNITSAHFTGVGALRDVTVGWMDRKKKAYKAIPIRKQVEVLAMTGDVAVYNGKPAVHTHIVVGLENGLAMGGHLLEAHVYPTLELIITVDPTSMRKSFDPETGLALIDPDQANDGQRSYLIQR
jgi:hypothetical protein